MGSPPAYAVRYVSYRALEKDHAAYLVHGGFVVETPESEAPPVNTEIDLRIETPDGLAYRVPARAGRFTGRGFLVSFERGAAEPMAELDRSLLEPSFRAAVEGEDPALELRPEVLRLEDDPAGDLSTDPSLPIPDLTSEIASGAVDPPAPGEEYVVYAVRFSSVADYLETGRTFERSARLFLPYAETSLAPGAVAHLRLTLPGHNVFHMWAEIERAGASGVELRIDRNDEAFRKACLYPSSTGARSRLERERASDREPPTITRLYDQMPEEDPDKMPIRRRLARMGMEDKMNLALSGDREERMALAMDSNRAVHHYLLKNAKITLDEIAFMARLPSLNPDVLEKIAENPAYTQNSTVTKALVYNPKTPVNTAIRLLDRLPSSEVMSIAKRSNMNARLVQAAKKKVQTKKW